MTNIEDFAVAKMAKTQADTVQERLTQIGQIAANSPDRAGCKAIATICESMKTTLPQAWMAMLAVSVTMKTHVVFEMGSGVQPNSEPGIFLTIELYPPAQVELVIFRDDRERIITWHKAWMLAHAEDVWNFTLATFSVMSHVVLRGRSSIEEESPNRIVFLNRGEGDQGWIKVTIDLSVAEVDVAYMAEVVARREENKHA